MFTHRAEGGEFERRLRKKAQSGGEEASDAPEAKREMGSEKEGVITLTSAADRWSSRKSRKHCWTLQEVSPGA